MEVDEDAEVEYPDIYEDTELEKFVYENCIELYSDKTFQNELAKQKLILHGNKVYHVNDYNKENVLYDIANSKDLYTLKKKFLETSKITKFKFNFDKLLSLYTNNTFFSKIILSLISVGNPKYDAVNSLYHQILQDSFDDSKNIANHANFFINEKYFLIPFNYRILTTGGIFLKIDKKLWYRTLVLEFTKHFVSNNKKRTNFVPTFNKMTFIENFDLDFFVANIIEFNDIITIKFRKFFSETLYDYISHIYGSNLSFLKEYHLEIFPSHYGEKMLFYKINATLKNDSESITLLSFEIDQSKSIEFTNYENKIFVEYIDMFVSLFSQKKITRCELTWPNKKKFFQTSSGEEEEEEEEEEESLLDFEHLFLKNVLCSCFTLKIGTINLKEDNSKKKRVDAKIYFVPIRITYGHVITDMSNVYSIYENTPASLKNITSENTFLSFYKTSNSAAEFTNKIKNFENGVSVFRNLSLLDKSFNILLDNFPEMIEANKNNTFKIVDYDFLSNNNNIKFIDSETFNVYYKFFYYFEID